MPGKHAPDSPRSFYVSLGRALGAALGAVGLMVAAVLVLLSRGGGAGSEQAGSPVISPRASVSTSTPRSTRSPTLSPSPTASPTVLAPRQVTVHVQNGTSHQGLASKTADKIRAKGYKVTAVDNAPAHLAKSTIFYRPGREAEALAFQRAFPQFTVLKETTGAQDAFLLVVLGGDYP
jgi:LytR cell envelope-related transcriptional attenuator